MPRWLRRTLVVLAVLLVILGGAYYWFFADGAAPANAPAFALDMTRVRALSAELAGDKPTEIHVQTIASMSFPQTAVVAGDGFAGLPMGIFSYQLVYPHQTIIIDTALDEAAGKGFGAAFEPGAYASMDEAMLRASQILITHEHPDHIGGIMNHPDPTALVPKLSLSVEQLSGAGRYAGFTVPPAVLAEAKPVAYDDYLAIAPGVVLIKAPGHSPGSQMIFVTRADGKEFLFVGDIAWSLRNIETVRGRARIVSQFMLNEERDAVFGQLATLHALHEAEPELEIVPGHDAAVVDSLVEAGEMIDGFVIE